MARTRAILGLIGGIIILGSSAAHIFLGWPTIRTELSKASVPPDLAQGMEIAWNFGGVAMVAVGCIVIALFARRLRGGVVSGFPAMVISLLYLGFGSWALAITNMNPFYFIFIVPGLLLAMASFPSRRR